MSTRAEAILLTKQASVPELVNEKIPCSLRDEPGKNRFELECYVAKTHGERMQGLMGIQYLSSAEGMLFVYNEPVMNSFWMKNTSLPLTIIWFDGDRRYLGHTAMQPFSTSNYYPPSPFVYALEILTKTAEELDLGYGTVLELQ